MIGWKCWVVAGLAWTSLAGADAPRGVQDGAQEVLVCPPCGGACDARTFTGDAAKSETCPGCGMRLVAQASVPHVAVLVLPGTDVASFAGPASVFASSHTMNVFTVADTTDPIQCQGYLSVVPTYAFDDAPEFDILIVPPIGHDEIEDDYIIDWIAKVSEGADFVLTVGTGSIALARTGMVDGETLPAGSLAPAAFFARFAPNVSFSSDDAVAVLDKFVVARDNAASIEAALHILSEASGDPAAETAATALGYTWPIEVR